MAFFVARVHARFGLLVRAVAVASLTIGYATDVLAQATPIAGSTTGAIGKSYERVSDDLVRAINERGKAPKESVFPADFSMGRAYKSTHDGYDSSELGQTVPFKSHEISGFAAAFWQLKAPQAGSRLTVGAFAGGSELDMSLGALPSAGILDAPGKSTNTAFMYGAAATYGVGTFYATATATGASGETHFVDRWNGVAFALPGGLYERRFNTSGYILSGVAGQTFQLFGDVHAGLEGGLRRLNFSTDKYLSQLELQTFENDMSATTGMVALGLFTNIKTSQGYVRPYVRGSFQHDLQFSQTETARVAGTGAVNEVITFDRDPNLRNVELGINWTTGTLNLNAAAFAEGASDHTTLGGRLGLKIVFE